MIRINPKTLRRAILVLGMLVTCGARADIRIYPGVAPCDTTLQACVTGANAGDTIRIARSTLIDESVTIAKSLTVEPETGFAPKVRRFGVDAGTTSISVSVHGMAGGGGIEAIIGPGGGDLTLTVENNAFTAHAFRPAIEVGTSGLAGSYGQLTLRARGNTISSSGEIPVTGIRASSSKAVLTAEIVRNTIQATGMNEAIDAYVSDIGGGAVLIERNVIQGADFNSGILLTHSGAADGVAANVLAGTIVGNLVTGQNGNAGASGGIVLSASGTGGQLAGTLINNTVARGRSGIAVSARSDLGARVRGLVANNIVAFNSLYNISIAFGLSEVANDHNLVSVLDTESGTGLFSPGPGTLIGDPRFVNAAGGDFRLASNSFAIDAGRDSVLPATYGADLDGAPRRHGVVDMGAYESLFAPPPPAGVLEFSAATYGTGERGGSATITVTRTAGSNGAVSVDYASADGSAAAPGDYAAVSGTLTWADGDTAPKTFTIPIVDDAVDEGAETVALVLTTPVGGARLGVNASATLTISDRQALAAVPVPTLSQWGLILLALALDVGTLWFLYGRRAPRGGNR